MYKIGCTGHFVPPWNVQISPPDSKWRQFASTLPYVVGHEKQYLNWSPLTCDIVFSARR